MKAQKFTREQKLLHRLILHSHDVPAALGLFDGMTGILLVLAHYARLQKQPLVEQVSDYLMEKVTESMARTDSVHFGNGMAGIGWGIEYLIQNGYMKGCGVDITHEVDEHIMSLDIRRITDEGLEQGIEGIFHYVIAHVQGASLQGRMAFDRSYLNDWLCTLQARQAQSPNDKRWVEMRNMLEETLQGKAPYSLDLAQFVNPMKNVPAKLLGLRKGLAGYLEIQLHKQEIA